MLKIIDYIENRSNSVVERPKEEEKLEALRTGLRESAGSIRSLPGRHPFELGAFRRRYGRRFQTNEDLPRSHALGHFNTERPMSWSQAGTQVQKPTTTDLRDGVHSSACRQHFLARLLLRTPIMDPMGALVCCEGICPCDSAAAVTSGLQDPVDIVASSPTPLRVREFPACSARDCMDKANCRIPHRARVRRLADRQSIW